MVRKELSVAKAKWTALLNNTAHIIEISQYNWVGFSGVTKLKKLIKILYDLRYFTDSILVKLTYL